MIKGRSVTIESVYRLLADEKENRVRHRYLRVFASEVLELNKLTSGPSGTPTDRDFFSPTVSCRTYPKRNLVCFWLPGVASGPPEVAETLPEEDFSLDCLSSPSETGILGMLSVSGGDKGAQRIKVVSFDSAAGKWTMYGGAYPNWIKEALW